MKQNEALKYLKAITEAFGPDDGIELDQKTWANLHTAIKEALAQTQEPVAWMKDCADFWDYYICLNETAQEKYDQEAQIWIKTLRTTPPQHTWVGLTDEEICTFSMWLDDKSDVTVFTAIEAKLKEKNT